MMISNERKETVILITDDDEGHAELIHEHLIDSGIINPILHFNDGLSVWNFLSRSGNGPQMDERHPYLLLLDIRMPKMDGVEVLRKIKNDPLLHSIPVIMLTTTNDPREIEECYEIGCNSYITKPVNYQQFGEAIKRLGLFISIMQIAPVQAGNRGNGK